ncbi:hypothetical protein Tco_0111094 [Tanacetum coccineum]
MLQRSSHLDLRCACKRSNFKLVTPFANPERQFRARSNLTPISIHNIFSFYESEALESKSEEMVGVDIDILTMEQYMALTRGNQEPGVDDAHEHVQKVLEIVNLFSIPSVGHDAIMLRVFPITLTGAAKRWKDRLPTSSIDTWALLKKAFIKKYCPPSITAKQLDEIHNFKQNDDETLYHAWESVLATIIIFGELFPNFNLKRVKLVDLVRQGFILGWTLKKGKTTFVEFANEVVIIEKHVLQGLEEWMLITKQLAIKINMLEMAEEDALLAFQYEWCMCLLLLFLKMVVMMQPWNKSGKGIKLWNYLEAKYMAEDASNFKHALKHLKEELTLVELGSHLRIEESLRAQDSDKPKGNNVVGPQTESRVLGAVVKLLDPKLKTLGERGIECIFVGCVEHSKALGSLLLNLMIQL